MPPTDIRFELAGEVFFWDSTKGEANWRKHGVRFEEAATVFFDPLFVWSTPPETTRRATQL